MAGRRCVVVVRSGRVVVVVVEVVDVVDVVVEVVVVVGFSVVVVVVDVVVVVVVVVGHGINTRGSLGSWHNSWAPAVEEAAITSNEKANTTSDAMPIAGVAFRLRAITSLTNSHPPRPDRYPKRWKIVLYTPSQRAFHGQWRCYSMPTCDDTRLLRFHEIDTFRRLATTLSARIDACRIHPRHPSVV